MGVGEQKAVCHILFFLFLCHFPDSFNTIIRRALLPAASAAGQETQDRESERIGLEMQGVETIREMRAEVFVMQGGKDVSVKLCFWLMSITAMHLSS